MPVYRYKNSSVDQSRIQRSVSGALTWGTAGPSIYLDVTASSGDKTDLDEAMLASGYVFDSQDPTTTPQQQAANTNLASYAGDPASPTNGTFWYDSALGVLKYREAGATKRLTDVWDFLLENQPTDPGTTYTNTYTSGKVTQEVWKRTADSSNIKTVDYTYSSNRVATETTKVYAENGSTIVAQTTKTISYTLGLVTGQTLVRNV